MPTIASENTKPIRQALTVMCGMDVASNMTPSATAVSSYDSYNGDVTGVPLFSPFMDLSGDGFLNDGMAKPLEADHAGIVANVNAAGNSSTLNISITLSQAAPAGTVLKLYYYEGNAELHTVEMTVTGTTASAVITSTTGRLHLVKVTAGDSWWFNNDSLISCTVSLRGVETKIQNPELQISDIEIVGYEPNNILDKVAMIGEKSPVYYTSGYPGDMAPVRTFYLSEQIGWEDKKITIKAEDATQFLQDDYAGAFIGNPTLDDELGGIKKYIDQLHAMLNSKGIAHTFSNIYNTGLYNDGQGMLFTNKPIRDHIAQAVNLFRFARGSIYTPDPYPCYINYVDAGIPRLWTGRDTSSYWVIDDIANLRIDVNRKPKEVRMNINWYQAESSAQVQSLSISGTKTVNVSDPYWTFSTNSGTITKLSPYAFKLKANGTATVSGRKLITYDGDAETFTPYKRTAADGVDIVELDDFDGLQEGYGYGGGGYDSFWPGAMDQLLNRELLTYSFTWRGNPLIQPRDYIKVKIDGQYIDMTIDTVTLEHTDGGLTSQIVARKGWI